MRSFALGLFVGALIGAIAAFVIVHDASSPPAPGDEGSPRGAGGATVAAPSSAALATLEADLEKRLAGSSDARLAETLDEAVFERDWMRVRVVSRQLRGRPARVAPAGRTPVAGSPGTGVGEEFE